MVKPKAPPNPYNPAGGAHARRDFLFRGVRYLRGDAFPFVKLGLTPVRVEMLWRTKAITFGAAPRELVNEASDRRHGISPIPLPRHDVPPPPPDPAPVAKPRRKRAAAPASAEPDVADQPEDGVADHVEPAPAPDVNDAQANASA